ncbi:hypothetical protein RYX36_006176, partial [Vicia faba]
IVLNQNAGKVGSEDSSSSDSEFERFNTKDIEEEGNSSDSASANSAVGDISLHGSKRTEQLNPKDNN